MEDDTVSMNTQSEKVETVSDPKDMPKLWWLASVNIVYREVGVNRTRPVNVVFTTSSDFINETTIGNVNVAAQKQVYEQKKIPEKATIVDVVISGIAMLGVMSDNQFRKKEKPANDK